MHLLGTIALAQGDRRGAEIWWRKSLEREPRQIESWNALLDSPSD
jgi:hypothetical protein